MSSELDRIKNDLNTIEKALGLSTSIRRDWIQWMRRDKWISLWWSIPGVILVLAALLPLDHATRYLGLHSDQWVGLVVGAVLLALAGFFTRRITANDGRPEGLIREARRINGMSREGVWFNVALALQLSLYFFWGQFYDIPFRPFWAGLFLIMGSSCLLAAIAARAWPLLGWAIPFLAYALCLPLVEGHRQLGGALLGLMFIAVALSFSIIAVLQIRFLERQHAAD